MTTLDEVIEKITSFLHSEAKTDTIIGQQFQLGEFVCVPVMTIGMGFGGGGGEGKGDGKLNGKAALGEGVGAGGGAGLGMGPVGFLVTRGDEIHFISTRGARGLSAAFEKLPDMMSKFMNRNKKTTDAEVH